MPHPKQLDVTYWPVGQGLFGTADIRARGSTFRTVYDCGAWGWRRNKGSDQIKASGVEPVDLLVISHFHWDHIGGIPDLVKSGRRIKRAWLPYLAPKTRILYAASLAAQGPEMGLSPDEYDEAVSMVSDPARWFRDRDIPVDELGGPEEPGEGGPVPLTPPETPTGEGRRALEPEPSRPADSLALSSPVGWPQAFRRPSGIRASWSHLSAVPGVIEPIAVLIAWWRPLADDAMTRLLGGLEGQMRSAPRDMLLALLASKETELSASEAEAVAAAIGTVESRQAMQEIYALLQPELNSTTLFLMIQAASVNCFSSVSPHLPDSCPFSICDFCWDLSDLDRWCQLYLDQSRPVASWLQRWLHTAVARWGWQKQYPTCLWTGDAPAEVLDLAVSSASGEFGDRLKATSCWLVPHHGSTSSFSEKMYSTVAGGLSFVSCGLHNRWNHPDPKVMCHTRATVITEDADPVRLRAVWC